MPNQKDASLSQSGVNFVALQNLRLIRRRINDRKWMEAGARRLRKDLASSGKTRRRGPRLARKSSFDYQHELKQAVYLVISEYAEKGKISQGWDPDSGLPFPEHPNTRRAFSEATGLDEGHLRVLDEGQVQFTLDDAIQIARIGDMDLATFLTPSAEFLEKNKHFPLKPTNKKPSNPLMSEWLLWLHGYRPLPGQDLNLFIEQTCTPGPEMDSLDDPRTFRGYDELEKEKKRARKSPFFMLDVSNDLSNPNPFKALLTPFERTPLPVKSKDASEILLIQITLLLATQVKKIMSLSGKGSLKVNRKQFVTLLEFLRYCISAYVQLQNKLKK